MKISLTLTCALLVLLSACVSNNESNLQIRKNDEEAVLSMLYQQRAAEYRALCLQAYNLATERVRAAKANKNYHGKPLAIVTDLDETALDNSAESAWAYLHDSTSTLDWLKQWWLKGIADSVPGSVSFFQYAKSQGVQVFYISNRMNTPAYVSATMRNMNSLGFPYAAPGDESHFLFQDSNAVGSKESRRQKVEATDSVLLFLGDNLIDLDSAFDRQPGDVRRKEVDRLAGKFGNRYIVFPNAVYGDWENVLYRGFSGSPTLVQKDSIRGKALDTMEIDPKGHW